MKDGLPSLTAMLVAYARAIGTYEPNLRVACNDPIAEQLLPSPVSAVLARARSSQNPDLAFKALRYSLVGLADHLAVRTALIDAAVKAAVRGGARQLVVLGAGLDSRAHRLEELADVVAFEVDHPSTQRFKRHRAEKLAKKAREVRYAGCDFATVTLEQALASQGFDADAPAIWIWEGVTMYLETAAVDATLATLARLSVSGSTLIETYANPAAVSRHNPLVQLSLATLALMAEPIRFLETPEEMRARLTRHGLQVLDDVFPTDAAPRFGARGVRWMFGTPPERVCVASKL